MNRLGGAVRSTLDLLVGRLAQVLVLAFHRRVDVVGGERLRHGGPTLLVANHGNGFVDPAVLAASLRRVPRFIAKSTLWNFWPSRPLLALAGVIPVYRRVDGETSANASTFRAVHRQLAAGHRVAIFPEGTSIDRPALDEVRTGAARMALGVLGDAPDISIVPVGLSFESRVEIRPAVAVFVGEPIAVSTWARDHGHEGAGEDDRAAVRALTDQIQDSLAAVAPSFATIDERMLLRAAAGVAARDDDTRLAPTFGRVERLARTLAARSDEQRSEVIDTYRDYATRLSLIGLHDDDLETDAELRQFARPALSIALLSVAGPLLVALTVVHLPALALIWLSTSAVASPVNKGTTRLLMGLATGLLTWGITGALLADGWAALGAAIVIAVAGAVALSLWLPLFTLARRLFGRVRLFERRRLAEQSRADRARLIETVHRVAGV